MLDNTAFVIFMSMFWLFNVIYHKSACLRLELKNAGLKKVLGLHCDWFDWISIGLFLGRKPHQRRRRLWNSSWELFSSKQNHATSQRQRHSYIYCTSWSVLTRRQSSRGWVLWREIVVQHVSDLASATDSTVCREAISWPSVVDRSKGAGCIVSLCARRNNRHPRGIRLWKDCHFTSVVKILQQSSDCVRGLRRKRKRDGGSIERFPNGKIMKGSIHWKGTGVSVLRLLFATLLAAWRYLRFWSFYEAGLDSGRLSLKNKIRNHNRPANWAEWFFAFVIDPICRG